MNLTLNLVLYILAPLLGVIMLQLLLIQRKQYLQRDESVRLTTKLDQTAQQIDQDLKHQATLIHNQTQQFEKQQHESKAALLQFQHQLQQMHNSYRENFDKHQFDNLKKLQESLQSSTTQLQNQVTKVLDAQTSQISLRVDKLTKETQERLKDISGQVEKRLSDGFEKTNAVFADILKRLALIDVAQQKITELSTNVVSLQGILADKRSRGAFGEVQLEGLIRNMLPESNFSFQALLSNGKRADCMLYLPAPTGHIAIDAKFPLESYQKITTVNLPESERKQAEQQFKQDIKKHIQDISEKYIIEGETSDGAVMFIPAESVFAEIHSYHPDLIELAHKARVWLVSPTTMMAILTTARAVLKDEATRKQIHIIQEHLSYLAKDFERFQKRMDNLARHIEQANEDVKDVNTSAKKITSRFGKIEKVELADDEEIKELSV